MSERDSMVVYASYLEALEGVSDADQLAFLKAVLEYGFTGDHPELKGIAKSLFTLVKPQIDSNSKRYTASVENGKKGAEHGKKGGRPKKQKPLETPRKPLDNPPKGLSEKPLYDTDTDTDTVDVNESDTVNDNGISKKGKEKKEIEIVLQKDQTEIAKYNSQDSRDFMKLYGGSGVIERVDVALVKAIERKCKEGHSFEDAREFIFGRAADYQAFRIAANQTRFKPENWLDQGEYGRDYQLDLKEIQQKKNGKPKSEAQHYTDAATNFANSVDV